MTNALGLDGRFSDETFRSKERLIEQTLVITLIRTLAPDIKMRVTISVHPSLMSKTRKISVTISSERIISKRFWNQAIAKLKRQTQINRKSKSFSLSDLQFKSSLSKLTPWFSETMREMTEIHATLIAEEGY